VRDRRHVVHGAPPSTRSLRRRVSQYGQKYRRAPGTKTIRIERLQDRFGHSAFISTGSTSRRAGRSWRARAVTVPTSARWPPVSEETKRSRVAWRPKSDSIRC